MSFHIEPDDNFYGPYAQIIAKNFSANARPGMLFMSNSDSDILQPDLTYFFRTTYRLLAHGLDLTISIMKNNTNHIWKDTLPFQYKLNPNTLLAQKYTRIQFIYMYDNDAWRVQINDLNV